MANRPIQHITGPFPIVTQPTPTTVRPNVPIPQPTPTTVRPNIPIPQPTVRPNVPMPPTTVKPNVPMPPTTVKPTVPMPQPTIRPNVPIPQPTVPRPTATMTRQPPTGRAPLGGLRLGETERDAIGAHGITRFLAERDAVVERAQPNTITVVIPPRRADELPLTVNVVVDDYIPQDQPRAEDFNFQASPENTQFIQASIETARTLFPSLEVHIQVARELNMFPEIRRNNFPMYLRDASPFEIYKVYRGEAINTARWFLTQFMGIVNQNNDAPETYDVYYPDNIIDAMQRHRYTYRYIGFIRSDHVAGQAHSDDFPLTSDNFVASITPDQAILMEEWRKEALRGGVAVLGNIDLLGLRQIRDQYLTQDQRGEDRPLADRPPVLQTIGFPKEKLRRAVLAVAQRINPHPNRRANHVLPITRNYIRYEGEEATLICGRKTTNINDKGLVLNKEMPKTYYMMLYNELRLRGLLDGTIF